MHVCFTVCVRGCVCAYLCLCVCIYVYTYLLKCIHVHIYTHMHTTSSGQIAPLQRSSYSQEEETCLAEDSGFWARFFVIVRCLAIWYISHCALNIEYRSADVRKCMSSKMRLKLWKIEHVCYACATRCAQDVP